MRLHFCGARITELYHYEVKGEKTLRMIFEGEDDEGHEVEVAIFLAGREIDLLKEKLGPRNVTRFAPACVDCTVAQAKHFKFCPWCGKGLTRPTDKVSVLLPNGEWNLNDGLPVGPPCGGCRYWKPQYLFGDLICCSEYRRMRPGFSCYQPKEALQSQTNEIEPDGVWEPWVTFKDYEGDKLPIEGPPCRHCKHWNPTRLSRGGPGRISYDGIQCCTKSDAGFHDFSCYEQRGGTE